MKKILRLISLGVLLVLTLVAAISKPMWLAFSLWIVVYVFRAPLQRWSNRWSPRRAFIGWGVFFGLLVEFFAILNNINLPPEDRVLLNPNPVADMVMAVVYYSFVIVTWYWLLCRTAYTSRHVFLLTGLFGIVVEQNGAIVLGILGSPILGLLMALLILCIYGLFPLLAHWLSAHRFNPVRSPVKLRHIFLAEGALFFQYIVYGLVIFPTLTRLFK
jgi:hypothetical protein